MKKEQAIEISIQSLQESDIIPYDIYLWLPKNGKLILLARAGEIFNKSLLFKHRSSNLPFYKNPASTISNSQIPTDSTNSFATGATTSQALDEDSTEPSPPETKSEIETRFTPEEPEVESLSFSTSDASVDATNVKTGDSEQSETDLNFGKTDESSDSIEVIVDTSFSSNSISLSEMAFSKDPDSPEELIEVKSNPKENVDEIKFTKEEPDITPDEQVLTFSANEKNDGNDEEIKLRRLGSSKVNSANFLSAQLAYALGYTNQSTLVQFAMSSMKYFDEASENKIQASSEIFSLLEASKELSEEKPKAVSDFTDIVAFLEEYFKDSKSADNEKEVVESAMVRTLDKLKSNESISDPLNLVRWKGVLSHHLNMDSYSHCNRSALLAQKEIRST